MRSYDLKSGYTMAVHEREENGLVTAVITGTEEEVGLQLDQYLKDYHPMGYGTIVKQEPKDLGGGVFEAIAERFRSCD